MRGDILFGLFLLVFALTWIYFVLRGIVRWVPPDGPKKWIVAVMGLLVLVGACGFFGAALSAEGVLQFPRSFEWPVGYVNGVRTALSGNYVVPLVPSGRVQIYDGQWHFLRGWHVAAHGGDFKVEAREPDRIEVFTARGQHHYTFTDNGDLIAAATFSEDFYSLPSGGPYIVVQTSLFGWIFSSPFLSWATALIGFVGLAIVKKLNSK